MPERSGTFRQLRGYVAFNEHLDGDDAIKDDVPELLIEVVTVPNNIP